MDFDGLGRIFPGGKASQRLANSTLASCAEVFKPPLIVI